MSWFGKLMIKVEVHMKSNIIRLQSCLCLYYKPDSLVYIFNIDNYFKFNISQLFMQTLEFQQPYHSALLTSRQRTHKLSPKVTQVKPQIKLVMPFHIKQHHQDDSLMRQVLYYNCQDAPKTHVFTGDRQVFSKQNYFSNRSNYHQLKINSEYYDTNLIKQGKKGPEYKNTQTQQFNNKQKRSSSVQNQNMNHIENNLNLNNRIQQKIQNLYNQNKKIINILQANQRKNKQLNQKQHQKQIQKQQQMRKFYKSQSNKKLYKQMNKLKDKLAKNQEHIDTKQFKIQKNKIKVMENQLKKLQQQRFQQPYQQSYKQIQIKVKQTNKRIQCNQSNIKIQTKPRFKCNNIEDSDTDSQFSDF